MLPPPARRRPVRRLTGLLGALCLSGPLAWAQPATPSKTPPPARSTTTTATSGSALDGVLFYQLLLGEVELRRGEAGIAYQVMLEAAKRSRDEAVFRRAVDIALQARAGEQAVEALRLWRQTLPRSRQAVEIESQMMVALGRYDAVREPLNLFIELTPEKERAAAIASLPRLVVGSSKPADAAQAVDQALKPWRGQAGTRQSALGASAGAWLAAGDRSRSLAYAREAQALDAADMRVALVALELMKDTPEAEALVTTYLATAGAAAPVRAAYVRRLSTAQRYADALRESQRLTQDDPTMPAAWLMQGALQIELMQPGPARESLLRYLTLRETPPADLAPPASGPDAADDDADLSLDDLHSARQRAETQEVGQAYLMLAQAEEQLGNYAGAQGWLEKLAAQPAEGASASVLQRRASLLMRQGQLAQARALLRQLPGDTPEAVRARFLAEAQLLRDARQWQDGHDLLAQANQTFPEDADLLYEQALLAEKLGRFDDMERLLRQVMRLKPEQQHAYNALGYSLADRNVRLGEARELIQRALALTPGDPFITDSLAWVEFRLGRREESVRLLQDAYRQRPDVEIAAHLGEVLWSLGRQDEAQRVWREALARDKTNEVLGETLRRLRVTP